MASLLLCPCSIMLLLYNKMYSGQEASIYNAFSFRIQKFHWNFSLWNFSQKLHDPCSNFWFMTAETYISWRKETQLVAETTSVSNPRQQHSFSTLHLQPASFYQNKKLLQGQNSSCTVTCRSEFSLYWFSFNNMAHKNSIRKECFSYLPRRMGYS